MRNPDSRGSTARKLAATVKDLKTFSIKLGWYKYRYVLVVHELKSLIVVVQCAIEVVVS